MAKESKWDSIMIVGVAISAASLMAANRWAEEATVREAIKAGYEQVETESGKLVWVKKSHDQVAE